MKNFEWFQNIDKFSMYSPLSSKTHAKSYDSLESENIYA